MALPKQQHQFVLSVAEASELEKPPQAEGDGFKGCSTYRDQCSGLISVSGHCFSEIYPSNHQRGVKETLWTFHLSFHVKKKLQSLQKTSAWCDVALAAWFDLFLWLCLGLSLLRLHLFFLDPKISTTTNESLMFLAFLLLGWLFFWWVFCEWPLITLQEMCFCLFFFEIGSTT